MDSNLRALCCTGVTGIVRLAAIESHHVKQGPKFQKHTLADVYKLWCIYLNRVL